MNKLFPSLLIFFFALSISMEAAAPKPTDILAAVDAPSTITYLGAMYVKYKLEKDEDGAYVIATDDYWEPIIDKRTTECKWKIQTQKAVETSPYKGGSCLCSDLGTGSKDNDAQYIALTFQVYGPGVFGFWYKTSTYSASMSDYLAVAVDGVDMNLSAEGYDEAGDGSVTWEYYTIEVPGGAFDPEDGVRQYSHSSLYEHEITFIFYKDEPAYGWNDKDKMVYTQDGPEGIGWEKDPDTGEDPYWGPKSAYETAKKNFGNCVWLDGFTWEPSTPTLFITQPEEAVEDYTFLDLQSDASDFGYLIKYTTDGSAPTKDSPVFNPDMDDEHHEGLLIDTPCTIKAQIFTNASTALSPAVTAQATFAIKTTPPNLTKATVDSAVVLTATPNYEKNSIHYTIDGSSPTQASPLWTKDLTVTKATTLKAICTRTGVDNSEIATIQVTQSQPPTVNYGDATHYDAEQLAVFEGSTCAFTATVSAGETLVATHNGAPADATQAIEASNGDIIAYRAEQNGELPSESVSFTAMEANQGMLVNGLQPGWNLLGIPYALIAEDAQNLQNNYAVFLLDSSTGSYYTPQKLTPGEACWIFCPETNQPKPITLVGAPYSISQKPGWSLASPTTYPTGASVWTYQLGTFIPVTKATFQPGKGYLIYSK